MNRQEEIIQDTNVLKDLENKSKAIKAGKNITLLKYKLSQQLSSYKFLL